MVFLSQSLIELLATTVFAQIGQRSIVGIYYIKYYILARILILKSSTFKEHFTTAATFQTSCWRPRSWCELQFASAISVIL
jgi:hypothetical protein